MIEIAVLFGVLLGTVAFLLYTLRSRSLDPAEQPFAVVFKEKERDYVWRYRFEPTPGDGWGRVYIEELDPGEDIDRGEWKPDIEFEVSHPPRIRKLPEMKS